VAIEHRHEDRQAAGRAGRSLRSRNDGENGAVGRGDDGLLAALRDALGIPEKGEEEKREREKEECDDRVPEEREDGRERGGNEDERPSFTGDGDPQCATPWR
jgi:hypothetical protein